MQMKRCSVPTVLPRVVKITQTENIMVIDRLGEGSMGSYCLIAVEFQFHKMKKSYGDGWW